jgi:hypothetical protein
MTKKLATIGYMEAACDGYLDVASFVKVIKYDSSKYPNGVRYYDVPADKELTIDFTDDV